MYFNHTSCVLTRVKKLISIKTVIFLSIILKQTSYPNSWLYKVLIALGIKRIKTLIHVVPTYNESITDESLNNHGILE